MLRGTIFQFCFRFQCSPFRLHLLEWFCLEGKITRKEKMKENPETSQTPNLWFVAYKYRSDYTSSAKQLNWNGTIHMAARVQEETVRRLSVLLFTCIPSHRCRCTPSWVRVSSWNWCWLLLCTSPGPQQWVQPLQPWLSECHCHA